MIFAVADLCKLLEYLLSQNYKQLEVDFSNVGPIVDLFAFLCNISS